MRKIFRFILKTFVSLSLALLILLAPLSKLWILASFEVNKAYIVQNLCEQKAKEDNICQGACHLNKQLEQAEQEAEKIPQNLKDKTEVLFCNSLQTIAWEMPTAYAVREKPLAYYANRKLTCFPKEILHPPAVA